MTAVLGIETATDLVGVCVVDTDGRVATSWSTGRHRHVESLVPAVSHVLEQAEVELADLAAVAVDVGPGLFTGLRVGVTAAKGLAQGLGIGVIGVGSLPVLARAAFDAGHGATVAAVVDARRGEVFEARYRTVGSTRDGIAGEGGPELLEVAPPAVLRPEALVEQLVAAGHGSGEPLVLVGDGAIRYADLFAALPGAVVAGSPLAAPPPDVLVRMALEHLAAGEVPLEPALVVPDYRRDVDAKVNWQRRDGPAARAEAGGEP